VHFLEPSSPSRRYDLLIYLIDSKNTTYFFVLRDLNWHLSLSSLVMISIVLHICMWVLKTVGPIIPTMPVIFKCKAGQPCGTAS
jgi:hypothetical protein